MGDEHLAAPLGCADTLAADPRNGAAGFALRTAFAIFAQTLFSWEGLSP